LPLEGGKFRRAHRPGSSLCAQQLGHVLLADERLDILD
jgi:hypothetical protein